MNIEENISLAPLTTLCIGGVARFFVRAESIDDVKSAVSFSTNKKLPLFILGGGSNVLISDRGRRRRGLGHIRRACCRAELRRN